MYLNNAWYCVGWKQDIEEKPKGIKVLGKHLVLFRKEDGDIVAMDGRCPHRFAPLHLGTVQGDKIRCPYHGLEYNTEGECVHNPQGDPIPPKARLNTYPVKEHNLAVWVWMGEKDKVSDELLPPYMEWTDSPEFAVGYGYNPVGADYLLTIDNLLDLSHVQMIHSESFGFEPPPLGAIDPTRVEFEFEGNSIHSRYYLGEQPTLELFKPMFPHEMCVQHAFMTLHLPSNLTFELEPAVLKSDTANLAARRKLKKMIADERGAIATD